MSCRYYLASIKKVNLHRIQNLGSVPAIKRIVATWGGKVDMEDDYLSAYALVDDRIDEIGDVVMTEGVEMVPLFTNESVQQELNEDQTVLGVDKEGLVSLIRIYQARALLYLEKVVDGTTLENTTPEDYMRQKLRMWKSPHNLILDLDESRPHTVTNAGDYEYGVFSLIHLLKTFDFDNNQMVVIGY